MPDSTRRARLERIEDLTPTVRAFHFRVEGKEPFTFLPGQFVALHFRHDRRPAQRSYSIASPPGDGARFELCVKHVASGPATRYLWGLRRGDRVELGRPSGGFLLREPIERGAVFVANGTGVTPFRPMLAKALPLSKGQPISLLLGARAESDLLYRAEWEELERRYTNFRFVPTLSRAGAEWPGLRGYVQDATPEILRPPRDVDVYVCGLRPMVTAVREQCRAWRYAASRVHFENYD